MKTKNLLNTLLLSSFIFTAIGCGGGGANVSSGPAPSGINQSNSRTVSLDMDWNFDLGYVSAPLSGSSNPTTITIQKSDTDTTPVTYTNTLVKDSPLGTISGRDVMVLRKGSTIINGRFSAGAVADWSGFSLPLSSDGKLLHDVIFDPRITLGFIKVPKFVSGSQEFSQGIIFTFRNLSSPKVKLSTTFTMPNGDEEGTANLLLEKGSGTTGNVSATFGMGMSVAVAQEGDVSPASTSMNIPIRMQARKLGHLNAVSNCMINFSLEPDTGSGTGSGGGSSF